MECGVGREGIRNIATKWGGGRVNLRWYKRGIIIHGEIIRKEVGEEERVEVRAKKLQEK